MGKLPKEVKEMMFSEMKLAGLGMVIVIAFSMLFIPAMAFCYDPIIHRYPSMEKIILPSGIYVLGWVEFRLFYFIMEERKAIQGVSIKEHCIATFKAIRKLLFFLFIMYIVTFIFVDSVERFADENAKMFGLITAIYFWNWIFFTATRSADCHLKSINIKPIQ